MPLENLSPGIRTRVLLQLSLALVIAGITAASLLIIRDQMQRHVQTYLEEDLHHSVETFHDIENDRLTALGRENALMADLPSLKALMTTNDARTIADDAIDFWKTSGNDLFALADQDHQVQAAYAKELDNTAFLKRDLQQALDNPSKHYMLTDGHLYEYSVRPLYFGSPKEGTLLGYVVSGFAINSAFLRAVGRGAGAEVAFLAATDVTISTLPKDKLPALDSLFRSLQYANTPRIAIRGPERYLAVSEDLTRGAGLPLQLVVMKSFESADRSERAIDWLVFWVGLFAMAAGSLVMFLLARMVTRPLESLAASVRAFGEGNERHLLPTGGPLEVRYLSRVFSEMRDEIKKTNRALLESERLATIGRMASSVSHDLRHYLAAVYANAEFLASPTLPPHERIELYEEIRLAVNGTTDMLDSLLIFSRTGSSLQRVPTSLQSLVEQAVSLVKMHPDADGVTVSMQKSNVDTTASVDSKQVERAVYNLLLNACQSARAGLDQRSVQVILNVASSDISVIIIDSGPGVAEGIRDSLFDPFVSEGKQKGTGLGLTLAWSVSREHGGSVELVSSRPGETIFRLTLARHVAPLANNTLSSRDTVLTP